MTTYPISVNVPTYNCTGYLPATLDSILSQSFTDIELLIIADCSVDNTNTAFQAMLPETVVYVLSSMLIEKGW